MGHEYKLELSNFQPCLCSHQWDCGLVGLRIGDVSLNTIAVYASVLLNIIFIFIIEEHLEVVSYKYITTILVINFLIKSISSKLL